MPVTLKRLDHVNLRTANLDVMVAWYGRILGMHPGPRPGFSFPGAWLYAMVTRSFIWSGSKPPPEPTRATSGSNISRSPPMASRT